MHILHQEIEQRWEKENIAYQIVKTQSIVSIQSEIKLGFLFYFIFGEGCSGMGAK